jgi:hypothetical protein
MRYVLGTLMTLVSIPLLLWGTSAHGDGSWTYRGGAGKNEPLCRELLRRLNRYDRDESLTERCSWDVIASYPKFTEPPWEEIDPRKHEELIVKLEKYAQEGPDGYFHRLPGLKQWAPDLYYRNRAKDFIEQGARLLVWRTKSTQFYRTFPIPPGGPTQSEQQTIVRMFIPWGENWQKKNHGKPEPEYCVGKPHAKGTWTVTIFIVTPDLAGPDPNIDAGTWGILGRHALLMYEGAPLLVNGYSIWRSTSGVLGGYCDFEFVELKK